LKNDEALVGVQSVAEAEEPAFDQSEEHISADLTKTKTQMGEPEDAEERHD
jgi:hypothetical protein